MRLALLTVTFAVLAGVVWIDNMGWPSQAAIDRGVPVAVAALETALPAPASPHAGRDQTAAVRPGPTIDPFADLKRANFSEIVSRPLFSPARRPPVPQQVSVRPPKAVQPRQVEPPREPPLRFALVGVVINGEQRLALIRHAKMKETIKVAKGGDLKGWRVERIGQRSIEVSHKTWVRKLRLFDSD
jgi:hypothetical protein